LPQSEPDVRVLLVISKFMPEYSGPGHRLTKFYQYLERAGEKIDLEIICNSQEHADSITYDWKGYPVTRISSILQKFLPQHRGGLWRSINAFKSYIEGIKTWRLLSKKNYDILHIVGMSASTSVGIYHAYKNQKPKFIELVNADATPIQNLPLLRFNDREVVSSDTIICCISSSLKKRCKSLGLDNTWERPNPVDIDKYFPKNGERKKGSPADHVCLVCVGKFIPRKNQKFLIDVLAQLADRFSLVLAGPLVKTGQHQKRDQEYYQSILDAIGHNGLAERVTLIPEYVDAAKYIREANVVLLPSYDEGLGTTMLEGLACGVPVVANSQEAAYCQWIEHGHNGYLCELQVEQWVNGIKRALEIPESNMVDTARRIREEASHEAINKLAYEKFSQLVQGGR